MTLVDPKEYFEDTTAQCRAVVNPGETYGGKEDKASCFAKSVCKYSECLVSAAKIVNGKITGVRTTHIEVGASRTVIPYDYLVLATGSHYKSDIKTDNSSLHFRHQQMVAEYDALKAANHVLVVGGGLVGVEIAGDVAEAFEGKKRVTLVHAHDKLLKNVKGAHELALPVLEKLGVNVILGSRLHPDVGAVRKMGTQAGSVIGCSTFTTENGDQIQADKIIWCTGYVPNTTFITKDTSDDIFVQSLDRDGFVKVNAQLQVIGIPNVFACGDILSSSSSASVFSTVSPDQRAERTANAAFFHAVAAATNVKRQALGACDADLIRFDFRRLGGKANVAISLGSSSGLMALDKTTYETYCGMFNFDAGANIDEIEKNSLSLAPGCPFFKQLITEFIVGIFDDCEKLCGTASMYRGMPAFIDPKAENFADHKAWKAASDDFPQIMELEGIQEAEEEKVDLNMNPNADFKKMREELKAELAVEAGEEILKLKAEIAESYKESGKKVSELKAELEEAKAAVLSPVAARGGNFSFSEAETASAVPESGTAALQGITQEMATLKAQLASALAGLNGRAPEVESMKRMRDENEQELQSLRAEMDAQKAIYEANLASVREELVKLREDTKGGSKALIVSPRAPLTTGGGGIPSGVNEIGESAFMGQTSFQNGGGPKATKRGGSAQLAMAAAQMITALAAEINENNPSAP